MRIETLARVGKGARNRMLGDGPETRRAPSTVCVACVVRVWGPTGHTMALASHFQKKAPLHGTFDDHAF